MSDEIRSYSQAGQDRWVLERLGTAPHSFLDVGCNHPFELSNTWALEQLGWSGVLVDSDQYCVELCRANRPGSRVLQADATLFSLSEHGIPLQVDYLSLDIDHGTLDALRNLLRQGLQFKVATVEHDAYRFGDELRAEERRLLADAGYVLERADVGAPDWPFEDWHRHPSVPA